MSATRNVEFPQGEENARDDVLTRAGFYFELQDSAGEPLITATSVGNRDDVIDAALELLQEYKAISVAEAAAVLGA